MPPTPVQTVGGGGKYLETFQLSRVLPARNLGDGELAWEAARGHILERLAENGVQGLRFTRRLGVKPSVAAELIERVSHRGRQTLRLLLDKDVNWKRETTREGRPEQDGGEGRKGGPAVLDPIPEELFTRASSLRVQADWDTRSYSKNELTASCNLLVEEVTSMALCERTVVALRMLEVLCRRHTQARLHMSRDVEGLIRAGLPHFTWVMTSSSFRLAYVYQALAPILALEMTRYNIIERILRVALWESDLAARLVQNRVRIMRTKRKISSYPHEVRVRYMLGFNTISSDLNRQWRRMRSSLYHSDMTAPVRTSYMRTLHAVVRPGSCKYFRSNRRRAVEVGGLLFIRAAYNKAAAASSGDKRGAYLRVAAGELLCELSKEPSLLLPILEARLADVLLAEVATAAEQQPSEKEQQADTATLLCALKTLHFLALGAVVHAYSNTSSAITPSGAAWLERCAAQGLEDEEGEEAVAEACKDAEALDMDRSARSRAAVLAAVDSLLATPAMVDALATLATCSLQVPVFQQACLALHSLSCISGAVHGLVLDRMTRQGCRTFEVLLQRRMGQQGPSASVVTALFLQLCSSIQARDLMVGRGIVRLVPVPVSEDDDVDYESLVSVCALRCLVGLAQVGDGHDFPPWRVRLGGFTVARARDGLYDAMYVLAKDGEARMRESLRCMKRMRLTPLLLAYLVRPLREPLSPACQAKGSIMLHGMLLEPEVAQGAPQLLRRRLAEHVLVMIEEGAATALTATSTSSCSCKKGEGGVAADWAAMGMRAALLALCRLVVALGPPGLARVWEGAIRHNLLSSLRALLDAATWHLLERWRKREAALLTGQASSAATGTPTSSTPPAHVPRLVVEAVLCAIEHLGPLPAYEVDARAVAATEACQDVARAEQECEPNLLRLCEVFVPVLTAVVSYHPQRKPAWGSCLSAALAALARLSTTYRSCMFLIDADVLGALASVSTDPFSQAGLRRRDLPASYYHLLASLARVPALRARLHDGFLKDAVARLLDEGEHEPDDATTAHVLMLVARVAHVHSVSSGQADDLLLAPDAAVITSIVHSLLKQPPAPPAPLHVQTLLLRTMKTARPGQLQQELALSSPPPPPASLVYLWYCAATAAASLMRDVLKAVPRFVQAGLVPPLVALVSGYPATPHPLLRRAMEGLHLITTHPLRLFHNELEQTGLRHALFRVSNSKELCRAPQGLIPIGHLGSEILLLLDRKNKKDNPPPTPAPLASDRQPQEQQAEEDEQGGQTQEQQQAEEGEEEQTTGGSGTDGYEDANFSDETVSSSAGTSVSTVGPAGTVTRRLYVTLPSQHMAVPLCSSYADYGVSACGPLASSTNPHRQHEQHRHDAQRGLVGDSKWRSRYYSLQKQQPRRSAAGRAESEPDRVGGMRLSLIKSRPSGPAPTGTSTWKGQAEGGNEESRAGTGPAGDERRLPVKTAAGGKPSQARVTCLSPPLLDPIFVSTQDDGPDNPTPLPSLQPKPSRPITAGAGAGGITPFTQATVYSGHLVEVQSWRKGLMPLDRPMGSATSPLSSPTSGKQERMSTRQLQRVLLGER